jgi:hypothetical protein
VAAKSTTTMRQIFRYQPHQAAWFAATQTLFNRVCACYFEVIQARTSPIKRLSRFLRGSLTAPKAILLP